MTDWGTVALTDEAHVSGRRETKQHGGRPVLDSTHGSVSRDRYLESNYLREIDQMLKPLQTACLAGTGLLAIGEFLLACAGDQISARRPEVTTSAASVPSKPGPSKSIDVNRPVEAPVPFLVAMQESPTSSQHGVRRLPVSNVGWIGLVLEDKNGVRVGTVFPGGPAAFAGVRVGDMLMRVGGTNVESMQVASAAIERLVPQQQTSLTIQHGGKTVELKVTPDSYAEFQQNYIAEMMRAIRVIPSMASSTGSARPTCRSSSCVDSSSRMSGWTGRCSKSSRR